MAETYVMVPASEYRRPRRLSKQEEDNRYIFAYLDMCLKGFGFDDDEKAAVELMRSNSHFKQILDRTVAVEIARQQKNDGQ